MKRKLFVLMSLLLGISMSSGCSLFPFKEDLAISEIKGQKAEPEEPVVQLLAKANGGDAEETAEVEIKQPYADGVVTEPEIPEVSQGQTDPEPTPYINMPKIKQVLARAGLMAAQYDYEGAIALLNKQAEIGYCTELQQAVAKYTQILDTCVEYPLEEITHVFFHTLIVDNSKAFDGDFDEAGYNQYMTTIPEFNRIIQIMYDKGYVMVSPHDMAVMNEDGTMSRGRILLPPGKIPFVLSQDDVSFYHYMSDDGFATKLVVNENGEIKAQYVEDDGTISIGDYDMVPLIDSFLKRHPDFSYHGRRGILAMTGYNGLLGYRTDIAYKTRQKLQEDQQKFLDETPDFNFEQEIRQAKEVASAMKAEGWEFASHTWGHKNVTRSSVEELIADNERWEANCVPILGATDMIIFAFGAEIGTWDEYTMDNPKYAYYKSSGYNYYMNVDSSRYWIQITDQYFRQGRRNLDGYRMYYNPEMVSDLFDVEDVWDSDRTTPVPPI